MKTMKRLSEEHKKNIGEGGRGKKHSEETRKKLSEANKGRKMPPRSEGYRKKISEALKGRIFTDEWKRKLSENHDDFSGENSPNYGKKLSKEIRRKISEAHKGMKYSAKSKKKFSESRRKQWQNKNYREKQIKAIFNGLKIKPNKPETILLNIIKKNKLPYKYTGDGSFWIEHINPDFVESNGKKIAIEIFGDYWHDPFKRPGLKWKDTEPGRKSTFKKYGWKSIILWEKDIYKGEEHILNKLGVI